MKLFIIFIISVLSTACSALSSEPFELSEQRALIAKNTELKEWFLAELPKMQIKNLYYIDPALSMDDTHSKSKIQGYAVLSQAKATEIQSSSGVLQNSLLNIIQSSPQYSAGCFDPHHIAILSDGKEQFYAIICFSCGNYRIFSNKGEWLLSGSFDVNEESTWDKAFIDAGITRSPSTGY